MQNSEAVEARIQGKMATFRILVLVSKTEITSREFSFRNFRNSRSHLDVRDWKGETLILVSRLKKWLSLTYALTKYKKLIFDRTDTFLTGRVSTAVHCLGTSGVKRTVFSHKISHHNNWWQEAYMKIKSLRFLFKMFLKQGQTSFKFCFIYLIFFYLFIMPIPPPGPIAPIPPPMLLVVLSK